MTPERQPPASAHRRLWLRCGLAARLAASSELARGRAPRELLVVLAHERATAGRVLSTFFKAFVCGSDGEFVVGSLTGDSVWRFARDVGRVASRVGRAPAGALLVLIAPAGQTALLLALALARPPMEPLGYLGR